MFDHIIPKIIVVLIYLVSFIFLPYRAWKNKRIKEAIVLLIISFIILLFGGLALLDESYADRGWVLIFAPGYCFFIQLLVCAICKFYRMAFVDAT